MPAGATSTTVTNEALQLVATQVQVASLTDGTPAAIAASAVYQPTVEFLLRAMDPDFARFTAPLTLSAAPSPVPPWAYEYLYPADMLRLRQVRPPGSGAGSLVDINDPQPVRANVAYDVIATVPTKVILTNQVNALAVYTSSAVTEAFWDSLFMDSVVRRLGNYLAMALSGRPDFARELLEEAGRTAALADAADEGGFRKVSG